MAHDVVHSADLEWILFLAYGAPTRHGNAGFLADVESL